MSAPVLTWGALGGMIDDQTQFARETSKYLEANEVYDLFDHLLKQLVVNQPGNPIKFLQEQLKSKPPLTVCLIGPPGISRSKYAGLLAAEFKVRHIHVGQLLKAKKELRDIVEAGELVQDDIVIDIVKSETKRASSTGYVLDGFPRTKVQAQSLASRESGFGHDKVLLLQTSDRVIR